MRVFVFGLIFLPTLAFAADPRLKMPNVAECVEYVKTNLASDQTQEPGQMQDVIGACREANMECVKTVTQSLDSSERVKAQTLLPLVKRCRGKDMGICIKEVFGTVPSFDRYSAASIAGLLKKCE